MWHRCEALLLGAVCTAALITDEHREAGRVVLFCFPSFPIQGEEFNGDGPVSRRSTYIIYEVKESRH